MIVWSYVRNRLFVFDGVEHGEEKVSIRSAYHTRRTQKSVRRVPPWLENARGFTRSCSSCRVSNPRCDDATVLLYPSL